ncbi:MAG TPA: extensin family protein [Allosphingosinicella sp.]|nr:extensin family protein [Allosphingosinicella sp.]
MPGRRSPLLRRVRRLVLLVLLAFFAFLAWGYGRSHPEDVPWTPLNLGQPVGLFTGRKLAALHGNGCRALLIDAGIRFAALPPRKEGEECGMDDAVRLLPDGAADIAFHPAGPSTSCRLAAGLALWEWHVVQPAALARFGRRVVEIDHFGSYNCRHMYGRADEPWSEHAHANALDVAGFRLEDGRKISVAADWRDPGPKGRFLHQVRDGACRLFATILSPDYNAAHHDHLHLDEAGRGAWGWRACR